MQIVSLALLFLSCGVIAQQPSTPVSRVVELMGNLAKQIEADGKKEEDLYSTYVCWAKSNIDAKTASNLAAKSRISELEQYIADIAAGRIEFTSERTDLEKDLEGLNADIEAATAMREKEKADYESASEEMTKTLDALGEAIRVLEEATADHQQGTMLAQDTADFAVISEAASANALGYAATLADRFLTKGDAVFLRRLLTGEVPTADWKKLNRKATFKMSYKARSGKIQSVLAKLQATFEANLKEATETEAKAQETYDKLMSSKKEQKASAEEALTNMAKENGARGMNSEEAQAEVDALKEQVANDTKYIAQVERSLAEKKEEWKERQQLRSGELAAISKAISILHSDDARDVMKRSYKSQAYSFLQTAASSRGPAAAAVLRAVAGNVIDARRLRLMALAQRAAAPSHFLEVIRAIDSMVQVLQDEEAKDLEIKETCETNRAADARSAIKTSREIDEMSDAIAQLQAEIKELEEQIAEKEQEIKDNQEELAEATRIRTAEHEEYKVNKKDDEEAHAIIVSATGVMKEFYSSNNLMLVQRHAKGPASAGLAGEAPPPPPPTWEAPYGGKVDESTGVLAILEMVAEDVQKDIATTTAAEEKAEAAYQETKSALEESIATLQKDITTMNSTIADKTETIATTKGDIRRSKGELKEVMETMAKAAPGCDFFAVNYQIRTKNRQIELDGLQKAKAILEGASFDKPDEGREIKPGDALLQSRIKRAA